MFYSLVKYTKIRKEDIIMVTIGLKIKNVSRAFKPEAGDVIIFDGKDWYITTKADLFKEYDERFASKIKECDEKIREMDRYQGEISEQLLEYGRIVKTFVEKESK